MAYTAHVSDPGSGRSRGWSDVKWGVQSFQTAPGQDVTAAIPRRLGMLAPGG
jgi:hypothetical protein